MSHTASKSRHAAVLLTNPAAVFGKVDFKKKSWADCEFTGVRTHPRLPLCVCVVVFGSVSLLFPEARLWKPTRRRRRTRDGTRWENRRPDELIGLRCDIMFPMFWTAFTGCRPTQRGDLSLRAPLLNFFYSLSLIQTDGIEKQHFWIGKLAFEMENKFEKTSRDGSPHVFNPLFLWAECWMDQKVLEEDLFI